MAKFIFALGGLGELGIRAEVLFEVAVGTRVAPRPPHRSRRAELTRPQAIEFFLRLHGLWEGLVNIPPPPDAPFDIDTVRGHPKCTTDGHLGRVQSAPLFGEEEPVFCRR